MYLKRLEMLGFKSFALRTSLEFSSGITAVVGPNGAGKSNVADAVRWVLGEQSMRQLRGKRSDDIIFTGGHGKAALGMAEVSLTLDNSTGWVPSAYSEINVTRRSYRSGENEYLINRQKVRLKDVVLLLAQARIGHDSYTVVGQGLIDAALSLRAEERRGLFEDAAGIRPFQVQRADAENRLRQTEQNLERLSDIVSEIEPRLAPLEEQARRAREFGLLNGELREALLTWYALQWRRLKAARESAEEVEGAQEREIRQLEQVISSADERGNDLRTTRQSMHERSAAARKACAGADERVRRSERDLAVGEERSSGLTLLALQQQQEERRLRERLIALQQRLIEQEEQCDLCDEALDAGAASLATQEAQATRVQREYEAEERRLRGAQNDLIQVQARLGASQTDLGRQQKHLGERNRNMASRRDALVQAQEASRALEARLVDERKRMEAVHGEEQRVTQRRQSVARAIADAQQEIERLKTLLAEGERRRRSVSDRLNMLKSWRQNLSGYGDGVRALLRAPAGKLTGLVAPLAQLAVAPAGLEGALEAALGPYLQAVVVRSEADAHTCLSYLQEARLGKAMLVWLAWGDEGMAGTGDRARREEKLLAGLLAEKPALHGRVRGCAWSCVQCEPRYRELFQRLLGGVVVVTNREAARELMACLPQFSLSSSGGSPFELCVTTGGESLHREGWLAGGSGGEGGEGGGLLTYERELRELPLQLNEHIASLDQLNAGIGAMLRDQEGRRAEQASLDKENQRVALRIQEITRGMTAAQREQERIQAEMRLATSLERQLAAEIAGLEQEVLAAQERVSAHETSQREQATLLEELQDALEERAQTYRSKQEELGRARTALALQRQEAKALHIQLEAARGQGRDLKMQLEAHLARLRDDEQRLLGLQETLVAQRVELEEALAAARRLDVAQRDVEQQSADIDRQLLELERQAVQQRHALAELEGAYRRCLLESQKARDALENLQGQLREEAEIDDPTDIDAIAQGLAEDEAAPQASRSLTEAEEAQLRKHRRRVDHLRSRVRALGGFDPDAPQHYDELRTRYEFLTTQVADMEQAALHLRSIIGQLDVSMARQFEATFLAVNTRFREHFTTLFHGGSARLELISAGSSREEGEAQAQAPTAMPGGVEVIVQPPGKKVQDLSLLSGGERALVSAALLFALLEINPPPFCLLDEVDAALDESNVTRFCDILRRLAQRTQFIVVTHNRVTMTAAQVIYGVSMGGDSVSRLLSMKLEEAPVAGDR